MKTFTIYFVAIIFTKINANVIPESYTKQRNGLLKEETQISLGGNQLLNEDEIIANNILMQWKYNELDESFKNPQYFNFSKHYFTYKKYIEKSKVYQIIRRMPKGSVLHVHSSLMLKSSVLIELTYMDHLYACIVNDSLRLHFSETTPRVPCSDEWTLVNDLRNSSGDVATFDTQLANYFTLYNEKGEEYNNVDSNTAWNRFNKIYSAIKSLISYRPAREEYNNVDSNTAWNRFNKIYSAIKSLISYRPAREKYLYESLKEYYEDNIMYVEIRTSLQNLYELDGSRRDKYYLVELYKHVTSQFIKEHPDFIGIKLIVTSQRSKSIDEVLEVINTAIKFQEEMPDTIAGFDLVGQEELGRPLADFLPILYASRSKIDYYLHAGETAWYGTSTDENLVDAIVLGSKRIGHGYALVKHPMLMSAVVKNNIALEVNVISNVVLGLTRDVRNHPLASYLAMGLPVVLSSDDPGAWSSEPLSHDFFVTFMGVASKSADLRMLKQLAINSITYSSLDDKRKSVFFDVFNKRWDIFIKELISDESLNPIVNMSVDKNNIN